MEQILAGLASNAMSEFHAGQQYNRETNLMRKQNALNKANALDAYRTQVEGMKMAGLSPAGAMNQAPTVPQTSKGSVGMAENVEFDPNTMLLEAQAENLKAQTEKTQAETDKIEGVDTKNVESETDLNIARKLWTNADTERVNETAEQIHNANTEWKDENEAIATFGQAWADKIQNTEWFNKLAPDTKATIKSIADGEFDLSIGNMKALENAIKMQKDISDADRTLIKNAFDNVITEGMLKQPKVIKALTILPDTQKRQAEAEIKNLVASAREHNINSKFKESEWGSERYNNPDWTWAEFIQHPSAKNFGLWLQSSYAKKLNRLYETGNKAVENAAGGAAAGFIGGKAMGAVNRLSKTHKHTEYPPRQDPAIYDATGKRIDKTGGKKFFSTDEYYDDRGVDHFNFEK